MSSSLPYFEYKAKSGNILKFLIDTGSNKNYIQPGCALYHIPNQKPFAANSVAGNIKITHHVILNLFGSANTKLKFFILPALRSFHGILGNDSLKDLEAVIHTADNFMVIKGNIRIPIKQHISQSVNSINLRISHLTQQQTEKVIALLKKYPKLFGDPDEKLTYTTKIKGEIRTNDNNPVYSKSYPYPMALKPIVNEEITKLLKDGIIRPSKSPYNAPVWVVPKKMDASVEKKYRLVIDYRKLNTVTIPDRYPIPEINEVLANLGNSEFFTLLDLKSGFHQIPLRQADIEKTAFSVNNGKFEFTRLPFGLKNAPSIFQRALDDILKEHIGVRCYVYIDDIVIFGKSEDEHLKNIELVFKTLEQANMKVQIDKCEFLKKSVEFLGFVISKNGITTNPQKVEAIQKFPPPTTLKELRSFLGLAGYYRRFIRDYAKLANPLTSLLRGEEGRISKNASNKVKINLNEKAIDAFNKIKNSLMSRDVILSFPNFDKEFELTTDASQYAIGAVLSQDGKPITFLSRTLNQTEENYATNEKEMLAIIWALKSLRNYLYGSRKVKIFTDHQPLTYALSNKNTNVKIKRWKAALEEYNYEIQYKPGKANIVADALSRYPQGSNVNSMTATVHSDESSSHNLIPTVTTPINAFRVQIILKIGEQTTYQLQKPFPNYWKHVFTETQYTRENLVGIFKRYLNPNVINGLLTDEGTMGTIQEIYPLYFSNYRIRYTQTEVKNIQAKTEQEEIIIKFHKRAHRNANENRQQIIKEFYFPKMSSKIKNLVKQCSTCKENKYERHPNKPILKPTPIPEYPGHILHIDIYSTEKHLILTAIDKFSKFAQARVLRTKAIEDVRKPLRELLFFFGVPKCIVIDGEKSLNSASITFMMQDQLNIDIYKTPAYKSEVNGQVERFHLTLTEIMRCLKTDNSHRSFEELLERSVYEYNCTIHTTTQRKPIELFYGRIVSTSPEQLENSRKDNIEVLKAKQIKDLDSHNKKRQPIKDYHVGEEIYVKNNKRVGSKLTARYRKETVRENKPTFIITTTGKTIHKSDIRN